MSKRDEAYMEYVVQDVLGHLAGITAKAMRYKRAGLYPFTYTGHNGKTYEMAYISVPAETLESRDVMRDRVLESHAISLAAAKSKSAKSKPKSKPKKPR